MNELHTAYSGKTFCKFKQWLEKDKMIFSFVTKENPKEDFIDIYMSGIECGGVLMRKISTGELKRKLMESREISKKEGKYPKPAFESSLGGYTKKVPSEDGKKQIEITRARKMTIIPGQKTEIVLQAFEYNAKEVDKKFVPLEGNPVKTINVGCSYDELLMMQYAWSWLEKDYMPNRYSLESLKNEYEDLQDENANKDSNTDSADSQKEKKKNSKQTSTKVKFSAKPQGNENTKEPSKPEQRQQHILDVTSSSQIGEDGMGNYFYEGVDNSKSDKPKVRVFITPEAILNLGEKWNRISESINHQETRIKILYRLETVWGEPAYFFEKTA